MTEIHEEHWLYKLLGVAPDATAAEVKTAYRRLAKTAHPDAGGDPETFSAINDAYVILIDPKTRDEYDRTGLVDRHTPAQLHNAMLETIEQMFDMLVDRIVAENVDVRSLAFLSMVRERLQAGIDAVEAADRTLRREIHTLKDLKARLGRKNQERNAFTDSIDRRMPKKTAELEQNTLMIKIGRLAMEELSYYEDSTAFFHAVQQRAYPSSSAASSPNSTSVFFSF